MARERSDARTIAAEAAIADDCARGYPALELFERVAPRVRRVVPYAAGCWKTLDPETLLFTGFGLDDPQPGRLAAAQWRFVENELLQPDVTKFRELARRRRPVVTLREATHGERERSARYREIHRKLGFGAEVRAMFRRGSACWGSLALVRDEGEPDFDRDDVAFLARVNRHVTDGLRTAMLVETASEADDDRSPGMLVLREDLSVESRTTQADAWLEQLPPDRRTGLELPAVVYAVARRARAIGRDETGGRPARARVALRTGRWLGVDAAPLRDGGDAGRIAVVLSPADPLELAPIKLELNGLSAREHEVARLLARGLSAQEIASRLWLSPHTVKDHTVAVYAKLGVANRHELTAALFFDHHVPAFERGGRLREFSAEDAT